VPIQKISKWGGMVSIENEPITEL